MAMTKQLGRWLSDLSRFFDRLWSIAIEWEPRCPQCQGKMHAMYDPFPTAEWDAGWYIYYACPRCDDNGMRTLEEPWDVSASLQMHVGTPYHHGESVAGPP
jgi:hypothetical protein